MRESNAHKLPVNIALLLTEVRKIICNAQQLVFW